MLVLIFGIPLIIGLVQIILALVAGIKIWRLSAQQVRARRATLRLLALNLIEPAINTVLVTLLLFGSNSRTNYSFLMRWDGIPYAAMITLPMVILLLPFAWANSSDPVSRSVNIKLGMLGLVRWAVTAITFVVPFVMIVGLMVLVFSLRWVKKQAYQTIGAHYQAIGVGPEGVMVGELGDFGAGNPPNVRP